ncbi:MAG: hypothetical protein VX899_20405 [Myxococcota bacterium]|nr:hypothetical protein [Myxococcota bacterium]
MILLLSSLGFAQSTVTVGASADRDYERIADALQLAGEDLQVIELQPDYENLEGALSGSGYFACVEVWRSVTIRSSDGEPRSLPCMVVSGDGVTVTVEQGQVQPGSSVVAASTYPSNQILAEGTSGVIVREGATFIGKELEFSGVSGGTFGTPLQVDSGGLELYGVSFHGNDFSAAAGYPGAAIVITSSVADGREWVFQDVVIEVPEDTTGTGNTGLLVDSVFGSGGVTNSVRIDGLTVTGAEIGYEAGRSFGSAVFLSGVDSVAEGVQVVEAEGNAIYLLDGGHSWSDVSVTGVDGGAFYAVDASLAISGGVFRDVDADYGAVVKSTDGEALILKGIRVEGASAKAGGVVYAEGLGQVVDLVNGRFCSVGSDSGSLFEVRDGGLRMQNSVLRQVSGPGLNVDGSLELVNNTFYQLDDALIDSSPSSLWFVNNAVVDVNRLRSDLVGVVDNFSYNLLDGLVVSITEAGLELGEGNLIDTPPEFESAFAAADQDCAVDPVPAEGSPLVDNGSPEIQDPDGGLSDIGAFGGPNAEVWGGEGGGTGSVSGSGVTLMGGCGESGGSAALLLLPLLLLGRRRD